MSYLIDVYQGEQKRETSFIRFATYVTMFPQLISGPIVRYGEVSDSLRQRRFSLETLEEGMKVFTVGLAFKVLLADRLTLSKVHSGLKEESRLSHWLHLLRKTEKIKALKT